MKKNKGFTLVELIIVMACFSMVAIFFWTVLESASKDSYTINDKVIVQSSVTSLMNAIQKDVQEAKIFTDSELKKHIIDVGDNTYVFSSIQGIKYEFDGELDIVTRTDKNSSSVYNNIKDFSITKIENKYGVEVNIVGGMNEEEFDKTRYELNSTFYSRNTM